MLKLKDVSEILQRGSNMAPADASEHFAVLRRRLGDICRRSDAMYGITLDAAWYIDAVHGLQ
jgi:hypothetical protein